MTNDVYMDTVFNARMVPIKYGNPREVSSFLKGNAGIANFTVLVGASKQLVSVSDYLSESPK